ncbi:Cof-type HAD-IIB family hydrolase [Brevibacterium sp. 50QC2O2]|uniref:HAD family hydrolase n=1 Tax=Brevibacterium sp. 50QC2O2 TaxID=2968459 RepID=UPI00211C8901|nr:Cof-type HAD-IIB family hydrolase [Brevibacterium sp. 50QC2O2]
MPSPRLIATDLDGTLLDPSGHVSPRTRAALDAARAAGVPVVPVTARNPNGLRAIGAETGFDSWALCGNGAYGLDLATGRVLYTVEAAPEILTPFATALSSRVPGVVFGAIRDAGEGFVAEPGYAALSSFDDHKRDPHTMHGSTRAEVVGAASLKLVFRHATVSTAELFAAARGLGLSGFEMTLSGAPFVELMAAGVTKASGLDRLCAHLGINRSEVVAFGDGLNDVDMLAWAGTGYAVANAGEAVRAAADLVAPSNAEDGFAAIVEDLLA